MRFRLHPLGKPPQGQRWPTSFRPGRLGSLLKSNSPAIWRIDETHTLCPVTFGFYHVAVRAGRPTTGVRRSALHNGVLLQGAMGTSAGIPATLPEEPLPAASEKRGERAHDFSENRTTGQPRYRGWALGLSRDDPV